MKRFIFLALFAVIISSVGTAQNLLPLPELSLKRVSGFNQSKFSWYEKNYASDSLLGYERLKFPLFSVDALKYNLPSQAPVKNLFGSSIYSPSFDVKNFWKLGYEDFFGNYTKFVDYVIIFEKGKVKLQKKYLY